jgi:Pentapeptide repeats (8 copies)
VFTDFEEAVYTTLWHIGTGAGKDRQTMTEQDQLAILHQGRDVWNQWRQEHHTVQPVFSGEDFRGAHLSRVTLAGALLNGADFSSSPPVG